MILLCIICGMFLTLNMKDFPDMVDVDMLKVNRLAHIVESNWEDLEHLNQIEMENYDFIVLDGNGVSIYQSRDDSGKGVKPEEIELVCNQYFPGEDAKSSGKECEGMGLYLAKHMMRKMHGNMETYHCNPGFGVRLLFLLS